MRIIRWQFKLLYIVGTWLAGFGLVAALRPVVEPEVLTVVGVMWNAVAFFVAVRSFRGANEDVRMPRAWWRMTARRPLSRRLGIFYAVVGAICLLNLATNILDMFGIKMGRIEGAEPITVFNSVLETLEFGALAFLYLNSAARLSNPALVDPGPVLAAARMYDAFNARLALEASAFLHPEVEWPKSSDGDYIDGRLAVRRHWELQWKEIVPRVRPLGISIEADGWLTVRVRLIVSDLHGSRLSDTTLDHVYRSRDGLFDRMEIRQVPRTAARH